MNKMRHYLFSFSSSILFFVAVLLKVQRIVNTTSGTTSRIIRRYENIKKRPNDTNLYRGLELDNDLKILLISNSDLPGSTVLLSLGLGSLNDSDECPGITNFVGEMLNRFGTSTYPNEEITNIIGSRLPHVRLLYRMFPETREDEQVFLLEMEAEYLPMSSILEIFAQCFNEPLFLTANSRYPLNYAMHHLDLFYSPTILGEMGGADWRFWQVEKSLGAENHPFNRSLYGNVETFSKYLVEEEISNGSEPSQDGSPELRPTILHTKLREFYSKWYSSNITCLVILGKESLDELERMTVPLFENMQNKHVEKLSFSYEQHPWGQEKLRHKIYVAFNAGAMSDDEIVRLVFRVPDIRHQYKTGPELYVRDILSRGGPGSLVSVLEERELCYRFLVTYDVKAGIAFFSIECTVPLDSNVKENEVIELVMQYIRLIRQDGINEFIFQEKILQNKIQFSYPYHANEPLESLGRAMHYYPMEDILTYKYPNEWKPSLVEEFLTYLTPDNMNVFINSKKFQDLTAEEVNWHKIPYRVETIPDSLIQVILDRLERWKTMEISSDFQAPQPNEFIAENLDIHSVKEDESENPYIAYESSRSRIWLSQNDGSSKAAIKFDLINLRARLNPANPTLLCIFARLLNHQVVKYRYASDAAEYEWNIEHSEISISIELFGYLDKVHVLLKKFMSKFKIDHFIGSDLEDRFEEAKEQCINGEKSSSHFYSAVRRLKYALTEAPRSWSFDEIISASQLLRFNDWEKFISQMLPRVFVEGLILGNCIKEIAIDIAKIIEMPFGLDVEFIAQEMLNLLPRSVETEEGKNFMDIIFSDTENKDHLHYSCYQLGFGNNPILNDSFLLSKMITKKCVDEQNDFLFDFTILKVNSVVGLMFWTKSTNNFLIDLNDSLLKNCLRRVHVGLQEMTEVELENYIRELIEEEPIMLTDDDETRDTWASLTRHWSNITRGFYSFHEDNNEAEAEINSPGKSDVIKIFEDILLENSPQRRKYTILLIPKNSESIPWNSIPSTINVEDVITFKNNSYLWSLPPPFGRVNFSERDRGRLHYKM